MGAVVTQLAMASIASIAIQLSDRELIAVAALGAITMRALWALHQIFGAGCTGIQSLTAFAGVARLG
jgi:hypothetical protein